MGQLIRFPRRKRTRKDAGERPLFPIEPGVPLDERSLPPGTDARPARFASDASPAEDVPRAGIEPDPEIERRHRRRRATGIFVLVIVFCAGIASALFGDRGYLDVRRQRRAYADMQAQVQDHFARVQALKREVERLRTDPRAVERIAREDLDYAAPGEIVLLLPGADPLDPHRLDAKGGSDIVPGVRSTP
jgi:cell division protein FtsB